MSFGIASRLIRGPLRLQATSGYVNQVTLVGNVGNITGLDSIAGGGGEEGGADGAKPVRLSLAVEKPAPRTAAAAPQQSGEFKKRPVQWFNIVVFKPSLQKYVASSIEKG